MVNVALNARVGRCSGRNHRSRGMATSVATNGGSRPGFADRCGPDATSPAGASPSPARRQDHLPLARLRSASRSEEHTSELQSLMRISYAAFFLYTNINNLSDDSQTYIYHVL